MKHPLCTALVLLLGISLHAKPPVLTLVIVIDQLAYHEVQRFKQYFRGGFHYMLNNGISYEHAYMPHAVPETAVGHAALSTGALPKDHGIIGNTWFTNGKKIKSDDDSAEHAAVFGPNGVAYNYGKSPNLLMVDTLSDQVMLRSSPQRKHVVVALSHKSRAAIAMAGKLGQAFWLDSPTGLFTSSKAYGTTVPAWVTIFNKKHALDKVKTVSWKLALPSNSPAYRLNNINNYDFSGSWGFKAHEESIAGKDIALTETPDGSGDRGPYELFAKTPTGNKALTDLAKACIDEYFDYQKPDQMLLWVSYSGLDKISHPFGPESLETTDMLFHLDASVNDLITHANKKVGANKVLVVLTADHGVMPIPELVDNRGYHHARRIIAQDLIKQMNSHIEKKFELSSMVQSYASNQFYLNEKHLKDIPHNKLDAILHELKQVLVNQPGIKRVWTYRELAQSNYHLDLDDLEAHYRNQLFKSRSGHLICQVYPYTLLTEHETGTSHSSPYDYDTHIPLMIYQRGTLERKKVWDRVWAQQLAGTLAQLLEVPRPSASTFRSLPGVFNRN